MADAGAIDLDAGIVVEKRGCGRPRGSKNKPKVEAMEALSLSPIKRHPSHPLGSKNKFRASTRHIDEPRDVSASSLNPPHSSSRPVFSFFAIAGAQCREQQRVPLKFIEFMDGRELREAILREK
jgi:hypothetical protein